MLVSIQYISLKREHFHRMVFCEGINYSLSHEFNVNTLKFRPFLCGFKQNAYIMYFTGLFCSEEFKKMPKVSANFWKMKAVAFFNMQTISCIKINIQVIMKMFI